jgi:hypothetical protein
MPKSYPKWLAPIVEPIVGSLIGMRAFRRGGDYPGVGPVVGIACFAGIGLAAGLIVMYLDYRKTRKNN